MTTKTIRSAFGALALGFLLLQFVRPSLMNSRQAAEFDAPAEVKQVLRRSCYPCHSNEQRLAWFDQIVPAYWLVARDVNYGRRELNFSELGTQPATRQHARLFESVSQIQMGAMPPPRYTSLHPDAVITDRELSVLRSYLLAASSVGRPDTEAGDAQYRQWIDAASAPIQVKAAPNGIPFPAGYRNWRAISSTDRADTNTLKMILGNDVAIQAVEDHKINPWPNGTIFAKVSWSRRRDQNGAISTGKFEQVAFMLKDDRKYASTAGWGWAQWMGSELKPFGTDATFAQECVACHAPLRDNDYVFTAPIGALRSSK